MSGTTIEPRGADMQVLPGRGLGGPGGGRAVTVQYEIDIQFKSVQVNAAVAILGTLKAIIRLGN